jgi:hypothetical protein
LEQNSTSVDPDLINNINRLPYTQRFRLILNELGASLAGRGEDLEEVVKRANPLLRDIDRVFGILNSQRQQLAQLTSDSEQILRPFSRERASVAGFFSNAGAAAQASSERGEDLEASLRKLPSFLRELRQTMRTLQGFSDAAAPVFAELGKAAPTLTSATRALTPFSEASTVSLKSLGANGEVAGPKLHAADPVVRKTRDLAQSGAEPNTNLAKFLVSTNKTGGFDNLVELIYNTAAVTNEFDKYGHFGRNIAALVDCLEYSSAAEGKTGGCASRFNGPNVAASASVSGATELYERLQRELEATTGGTSASAPPAQPQAAPPAQATPVPEPETPGIGEGEGVEAGEEEEGASSSAVSRNSLLNYLLGP